MYLANKNCLLLLMVCIFIPVQVNRTKRIEDGFPSSALKGKFELVETGVNTGIFIGSLTIPTAQRQKEIKVSYGYLGLGKIATLNIQ